MKEFLPHTSASLRVHVDSRRGRQPRRSMGQEKPGRPAVKFFGSLAICLLISLGAHLIWVKHVAAMQADARQLQLQHAAAMHHENDSFSSDLQALSLKYAGTRIGVGVASDNMGTQIFGDDGSFDAASTGKLLTAAAYLHLVDEHKVNLQQQLDGQNIVNLLHAMIIDSDDDAWATLNDHLGHAYLQSYARSLGLQHYDADSNTLTPRDMTVLLQKLADGDMLSQPRRSLLLSLMQKANFRDYIVAAVPRGVTAYHKVGFTDGNLHDVAVISRGNRWVALSIYTDGDSDLASPERTALLQDITRDALAAYKL